MATPSIEQTGSKRLSARRIGLLVVAAIVLFALGFLTAVLIWVNAGGGVWRTEVGIHEARLFAPTELVLWVQSCDGNPEVTLLRETDTAVQVKVIASSTPLIGGDSCLDSLEITLREPLGERVIIDSHTGETVSVQTINSSSD